MSMSVALSLLRISLYQNPQTISGDAGTAVSDRRQQGVGAEPTRHELFPAVPCISYIPGGQS